jgi:hypothetical protein
LSLDSLIGGSLLVSFSLASSIFVVQKLQCRMLEEKNRIFSTVEEYKLVKRTYHFLGDIVKVTFAQIVKFPFNMVHLLKIAICDGNLLLF